MAAPAVNADGDHFAYFGKRDKKWTMQLDGKHVAYVARRGDSSVPVVDHKAGTEVAAKDAERYVGFVAVSQAGDHLAYEIMRGGSEYRAGRTSRARRHVVVDGREGREYDALDDQTIQFVAQDGQRLVKVIATLK